MVCSGKRSKDTTVSLLLLRWPRLVESVMQTVWRLSCIRQARIKVGLSPTGTAQP